MSKKNNKSKKPNTNIIVKKNEELTSEEKEKLIHEGENKRNEIIANANKEADEIKNRAITESEKTKEKIQAGYIKEVEEKAKIDAEKIKNDILSEINEKKVETDKLLEENKIKERELKASERDIIVKKEEYERNIMDLESDKKLYKDAILNSMSDKNKKFFKEFEDLETENERLNKELKKKETEIDDYKDDIAYYLNQLENFKVSKQKVMELEDIISQKESEFESINKLFKEEKVKNIELFNQVSKIGSDPNELFKEKEFLEKENKELKDKLSCYPCKDEIEFMRENLKKFEIIKEELLKIKLEKSKIESELINAKTYESDLDNSRRIIRILELQRKELQDELDRIQHLYDNKSRTVFAALKKIDSEPPIHANYPKSHKSLENICNDFRNYLASRTQNPLYYDIKSIRTFIAGMAASRIIILQGMSGTGKSSLPKAFEQYMGSVTARIPVQSSWRDRNDLIGFYNDFEKRFKETKFLESLYRATKDSDNIHLIMLDEMNLSRIEYYFADFLSVLEEENPDNWQINLIDAEVCASGEMPEFLVNGNLKIGENTWFIGTANKDDSTFTITDKVYDRAIVLNFNKREKKFETKAEHTITMSYSEFRQILSESHCFSPKDTKTMENLVEILDENMQFYFEISFGNRIGSQIEKFVPAYVKCGGKIEEALDIIFVTKVLRKLDGLYDEGTKKGLQGFLEWLDSDNRFELFKETKETIVKMIDRM